MKEELSVNEILSNSTQLVFKLSKCGMGISGVLAYGKGGVKFRFTELQNYYLRIEQPMFTQRREGKAKRIYGVTD